MIGQVTLPLPPSDNKLFANAKKGRIKTPEYRAWQIEAGYALNRANLPLFDHWYSLTIHLPLNMRGDAGNRNKSIPDLLQAHGIIVDDKFEWSCFRSRSVDVAPGTCSVFITSVSAPEAVAA